MRVRIGDHVIPFPIGLLRGRLRLAGLDYELCDRILHRFVDDANMYPYSEILQYLEKSVAEIDNSIVHNLRTIRRYEEQRREHRETPAIILVLEGASATGKSLLAMPMIEKLGVTRTIGTDSIRQIVRSLTDPAEHPELFCHTYQAYKYRTAGRSDLSKIVRGYLAQVELLSPYLVRSIQLIIDEGTDAIIEGVHIVPGSLVKLGAGVLEVLIHPTCEDHRVMFQSKSSAASLRSVSSKEEVRDVEFRATREIQDYLYSQARENEVAIIQFHDYESAERDLDELVLKKMKELVGDD